MFKKSIPGFFAFSVLLYCSKDLIWLNLNKTEKIVDVISTKKLNPGKPKDSLRYEIIVQNPDSSTEKLILQYDWWNLYWMDHNETFDLLSRISKSQNCASLKIRGVSIPNISNRQIVQANETDCAALPDNFPN